MHDAARPLLPDEVIERVLAPLAEGWDGAVPGLPVSDTVKRVDAGGGIVETVDRDGLWAVQTPQAFAAGTLRRAVTGGGEATDCAGLVEAGGGRVKVVPGDPRLLKVTTADDLAKSCVMAVSAVVFDVGETLVDEARHSASAMRCGRSRSRTCIRTRFRASQSCAGAACAWAPWAICAACTRHSSASASTSSPRPSVGACEAVPGVLRARRRDGRSRPD